METRIELGTIMYNDTKGHPAIIEMELVNSTFDKIDYETGQLVSKPWIFTASGSILSRKHKETISCGQCLDDIEQGFKDYNKIIPEIFKKILYFWRKYHLNDLIAGTKKQMDFIENYKKENPDFKYDFTKTCKLLESNNLLIDNGYEYGSKWLIKQIEPTDLETLKTLFK